MIVQGILDFISEWIAGLLGLIPPAPPEWSAALGYLEDAAAALNQPLSMLGAIVPWSAVDLVISGWLGLVVFWLAMLGMRLVLWLVGR